MEKEKKTFFSYTGSRLKTDKWLTVMLVVYFLFCLSSGVYFLVYSQVRNGIMSLAFLLLIPLIYLVEYFLKIKFMPIFSFLVLFISAGSILGSCYELYTLVPVFDLILHGTSGILFTCLGFAIMELFLGRATTKKSFCGCLLFGIMFSLAIAVVWELFEYTVGATLGFDMMEDTFVYNFKSYLLAGSHNELVRIDGITKTIIYLGNGESITLNGYLDLGLIDTITDMLICFIGTIVFMIISIFSFYKCPKINELLMPELVVAKEKDSNNNGNDLQEEATQTKNAELENTNENNNITQGELDNNSVTQLKTDECTINKSSTNTSSNKSNKQKTIKAKTSSKVKTKKGASTNEKSNKQ